MELSLRLDTLGLVEMRYLRGRERYRDWPSFRLLAASRQASVMAYMGKDVAEQLHEQILAVEAAVGLDIEDEDEEDEEDNNGEEEPGKPGRSAERDGSAFSPSLAQALERLNELARQRLPEGTATSSIDGELEAERAVPAPVTEEEDALEQLQDAFIQMMEIVRELAEEMATDALKLTGRFRCARTNIIFTQAELDADEDEDEDEDEEGEQAAIVELEVELVMVLQLFEEGRAKADDIPAVELQLDVEDFERLHETLDIALQRESRSRRRR
jgi:hypothetical protein